MLRRTHVVMNNLWSTYKGIRFGFAFAALAWWSFLISIVTGILLSFHYRPWGDVFKTVSFLSGFIPYGSFIRTLHYLSGQCFFIFTMAHLMEAFWNARYRAISSKDWIKFTSIPVIASLLLFTGFILKGDKEGILAAGVMFHLIKGIPLIGSGLAQIFLRPGESLFLLPFIHHVVILPVMVLFLLVQHRRRLLPKGDLGWLFLAALSLLAMVYPMPADIPPHMELKTPSGPWFFQGVQFLLRYAPPLLGGILWPLLPLLLMAVLPLIPLSCVSLARKTTIISLSVHGIFLLLAFWLIPRLGA